MATLYLKQMELGPMQNYVYLIGDADTKEVVIVDPGWEAPRILEALRQDGLTARGMVVTHTHFDHVDAIGPLRRTLDVPIYVHQDEPKMFPKSSVKPTTHGQTALVGQVLLTFVHTPGHTSGSQCIVVEGRVLSGDTLFVGGCGRTDLPGGDPAQMYESLTQRLAKLDAQTVLLPGHNYGRAPTSTLAEEQRSNPYFQFHSVQEFVQAVGPRLRAQF